MKRMDKNKLLKKVIHIFMLIMLMATAFGVEVVENAIVQEKKPLLTDQQKEIIIWGLIIMIFLALLSWLIWWIWKKIKENERKDSDLLYSKYLIDCKNTHQNRDTDLKYKNIFTFFLLWKRADVILNTERGMKYFGKYNGELIVKDSFFLLNIHRSKGWFSSEQDIIIIPYFLRKLFRKEKINGKYQIILEAESIDEALNTDYYNVIVVKNPTDKEKLVNFNEYIVKEFMDKFVFRQTIKDNLLNYKESMDKVVEINPNIQTERKNPRQ